MVCGIEIERIGVRILRGRGIARRRFGLSGREQEPAIRGDRRQRAVCRIVSKLPDAGDIGSAAPIADKKSVGERIDRERLDDVITR